MLALGSSLPAGGCSLDVALAIGGANDAALTVLKKVDGYVRYMLEVPTKQLKLEICFLFHPFS